MIRLALAAVLLATPAAAQGIPFAPAVDRTLRDTVVPAHAALAAEAEEEAATVAALCEAPGEPALAAARAGFGELLSAFSAAELFRFGPAREDNRIERLFFWPDPRGRALAQVQEVIATSDASASEVDTLRGKSVAVQGLPALEFALFGTGSETLAAEAGFRCAYAAAVAEAIAATAGELAAGWGAFADVVAAAGTDGALYRSHGEAMQDILQAAADELELVGAMKIGAVIGATPDAAKPRLAPFWRSGETVPAMLGNLAGVKAVLGEPLRDLLGENAFLVDSAHFQIETADKALADVPADWEAAARDPAARERLRFAAIQIGGAQRVIALQIMPALGLSRGFNAADGD
jgi:predicted lipoprotein